MWKELQGQRKEPERGKFSKSREDRGGALPRPARGPTEREREQGSRAIGKVNRQGMAADWLLMVG